jgi:hypothetical protein
VPNIWFAASSALWLVFLAASLLARVSNAKLYRPVSPVLFPPMMNATKEIDKKKPTEKSGIQRLKLACLLARCTNETQDA